LAAECQEKLEVVENVLTRQRLDRPCCLGCLAAECQEKLDAARFSHSGVIVRATWDRSGRGQ
jgi:exonuclease VII small subunit